MENTIYIAITLVFAVGGLSIALWDWRSGRFGLKKKLEMTSIEAVHKDNVLREAEQYALVFSGTLHENLGNHREIAETIATKQCPVDILAGPDIDVDAVAILGAFISNPFVRFSVVRREMRDALLANPGATSSTERWKFRHFTSADGRNILLEEAHVVAMGTKPTAKMEELHEVQPLAHMYENRFREYVRRYGHAVKRDSVVDDLIKYGRLVKHEADSKEIPVLRDANTDEVSSLRRALDAYKNNATGVNFG